MWMLLSRGCSSDGKSLLCALIIKYKVGVR